jgi:hypothetical protein
MAMYMPRDKETGKYIQCYGLDPEQEAKGLKHWVVTEQGREVDAALNTCLLHMVNKNVLIRYSTCIEELERLIKHRLKDTNKNIRKAMGKADTQEMIAKHKEIACKWDSNFGQYYRDGALPPGWANSRSEVEEASSARVLSGRTRAEEAGDNQPTRALTAAVEVDTVVVNIPPAQRDTVSLVRSECDDAIVTNLRSHVIYFFILCSVKRATQSLT